MALLFSFSVAMDKFVIGRVVTAIDYPFDPVFDQARYRHSIDDATDLVRHGGPFLAARHNTRMPPLHASAQLDVRIWTATSSWRL
jgi:hypothetical protein